LLVFAERRHQRWVEGSVPSGRHPRSPPAAGRRRRTDHDQHHLWRAATRPNVLPPQRAERRWRQPPINKASMCCRGL